MNREILFRGKSKNTGEWLYGNLLRGHTDAAHIWCWKDNYGSVNTLVKPETIGQYTGLTDKNGNKIFEGDIVKVDDELVCGSYSPCGMEYDAVPCESHFLIGWDEKEAAWRITGSNLGKAISDSQFMYDVNPDGNDENFVEEISKRATIIGNIQENPELLERRWQK